MLLEFQKQNLKNELLEINRKIEEIKLETWLDVKILKELLTERDRIQFRLDFKS